MSKGISLELYRDRILVNTRDLLLHSINGRDWTKLESVAFKEAKEMLKSEAEEYAYFCITCDRDNIPLVDFTSWLELCKRK